MKPSPVANDIVRTYRLWKQRLGRELSPEDARHIAENVVGFFEVLAEWSRAEMPSTNDAGRRAAPRSDIKRGRR